MQGEQVFWDVGIESTVEALFSVVKLRTRTQAPLSRLLTVIALLQDKSCDSGVLQVFAEFVEIDQAFVSSAAAASVHLPVVCR